MKVRQDDLTTGTDNYVLGVRQTNGATSSLSDAEAIADVVADTVKIAPESGSGPDVGSATLDGPVNANVGLSGNTLGGTLALAPASGNDAENLTGNYQNAIVQVTDGTDPRTGQLFEMWRGSPNATAAVVDTVLADPAIHIQESDTLSQGTLTVDAIDFADAPALTVESAILYDGGSSSEVRTEKEWIKETISGCGPRYQVSRYSAQSFDSIGAEYPAGAMEETRHDKTSDTVTGTEGPNYVDLTDRTTDTAADNAFYYYIWSNTAPGAVLLSGWKRFNYTINTDLTTTETIVGTDPKDASKDTVTLTAAGGSRVVLDKSTGLTRGIKGTAWGSSTDSYTEVWRYADGNVTAEVRKGQTGYTYGTDPATGVPIVSSPVTVPPGTGTPVHNDWFGVVSDFSAGAADQLSGGLTKDIRQGLGYDEGVDAGSQAYAVGEYSGMALGLVVDNVTPCGVASKVAKGSLKVIKGAQAAGQLNNAADAFQSGDIPGGMDALFQARSSFNAALSKCFSARTSLLYPGGSKFIELFRAGDEIFARDEHDPNAPVVVRRVLQVFVRVSPVLHVLVGGRIIGTTDEHPLWVADRGWVEAGRLKVGDLMLNRFDQPIPVEAVYDSGKVETVYNLEVEGDHTYFVGCQEWVFDVWSHNANPSNYGQIKKAAQKAKDEAAGITRGAGGGVKHKSHGSGSDKSGTGQRRKEAKQAKLKKAGDAVDQRLAEIQKAWDKMTAQQRNLLKNKKGVDPAATRRVDVQ